MRNHMVAAILAIVIMVLASAAGCSVEVGSTPTGQSKIRIGDPPHVAATPTPVSQLKVVGGYNNPQILEYLTVIHDDRNGVTCWISSPGRESAISCIADSQLKDQRR